MEEVLCFDVNGEELLLPDEMEVEEMRAFEMMCETRNEETLYFTYKG